MILDDGQHAFAGRDWQLVTDQVMGGISSGRLWRDTRAGRPCLSMQGDVRLDNNGGFVQMALDLAQPGSVFDATDYSGIRLTVAGNGADYNAHLRTRDLTRVWQSYRAQFQTRPDWSEIMLPFARFQPHRTDLPLNLSRLHRLGLVAIGQAMQAELSVARVELV